MSSGEPPRRAAVAWPAIGAVALAVTGVLTAFSGRYGYHRDELYFLRAGHQLAFGYVDQGPLTPLLARVASTLFGDSLVGLRLASSLTAGLVVLITGLLAAEFGGGRGTQAFAAGCTAISSVLLAVGHLLSTTTFDVLAWVAVSWLAVRALRDGGWRWLLVGVVAGIGMENKALPALLVVALAAGILAVGPRAVLRTRWPWLGALVALALCAPYVVWQATHGWPELEIAGAIAGGSSGTSEPRWLFLPYQFVMVSPVLVPVWLAGLWRLARDPRLRTFRCFAVVYPLLAVVFLATGGKPYYLSGLYPVLLAAGAEPTLRWAHRGATRVRSGLLSAGLVLGAAVSALLLLPLVPVADLAKTPIVAVNYDAGETVGWPRFACTVSRVYAGLPAGERRHAVALTANYGEAGAIDHYRDELSLPPAYSGHNSYADWGPPPPDAGPVIAVGYDRATLTRWFGAVRPVARIDDGVGLDNDEQGGTVFLCRDRRQSWARLWPRLRHIG